MKAGFKSKLLLQLRAVSEMDVGDQHCIGQVDTGCMKHPNGKTTGRHLEICFCSMLATAMACIGPWIGTDQSFKGFGRS